jgi:hypothetical protein
MRKSITSLALISALAAIAPLCAGLFAASAFAADNTATPAPTERGKDDIQLQENAPDRYIVVKGDTLWSISGKFLKDPWRWPEVWRMNKEQIHSPHRIYPGNIIVLDQSRGQPQLKLATPIVMEKLDPKVRVEKLGTDIPSIAPGAIEPFLSRPLVIEKDGLLNAPRIVATREDRVNIGSGSTAYVTGIDKSNQGLWNIYRPGKALIDPDNGAVLGYEAIFLGTAKVIREGNPATIEIITAKQEMGRGDRLVPAARALPLNYVPHAPDNFIKGRIVSTYGALSETGANSIIAINRGERDGVEIGHVLALYRYGKYFDDVTPLKHPKPSAQPAPAAESPYHTPDTGHDYKEKPTGGEKVRLKMPDERYGLIFVFRVFDRVSYALIMNTSRPVDASDVVQSP